MALRRPRDAGALPAPGIYDDAEFLFGNPDRVFPILRQMNTRLLRVNLRWGGPNGVANRKPANPTTRTIPPTTGGPTTGGVVRAAAGVEAMFSIVGTPSWANGGQAWNTAPRSAIDLRRFAVAAARRYDGTRRDEDGNLIPPGASLDRVERAEQPGLPQARST